ncbi:MAG: biotin-dependent carboxyltransferase family protein [Cytophagales bacterium]|nr:biotin-dependent carboxyltransferase family protein [Cytophagales bacterium]
MSELLCTVKSGGLFTTIQDLGRPGFRQFGVPVSGALDQESAALANTLVGNPIEYPLLEITQTGPYLEFEKYGALAIAGANLSPRLNGIDIPNHETVFFAKGDVLSFGQPKTGIRAYLAFSGELQVERLFGSVSTHTGNQWGGLNGQTLQKGDQLRIVPPSQHIQHQKIRHQIRTTNTIRVTKSMEFEALENSDQERLFSQDWIVASESNRMGIRLSGASLISKLPEMISSPTDTGIIQLPPSGLPIVLMNDSAAIGGYPRICAVLREDLPIISQKPPGATIRLKLIT